jgi:3',5'-cyclic-AMP phosphodiesterase
MAVAHAELMSVGPDEVVVTFVSEPDRAVTTHVGERSAVTTGPFHHARITALEPATEYPLRVDGAEPDRWLPATVCTLARPPGALLTTIATANDVHLGETECGRTGDPATDAIGPILSVASGATPYPRLMNQAVVREMQAVQPEAVIVKGDLTDRGLPEQYREFLDVYGALGPRLHHVRGNHDAIHDPRLARQDTPYTVDVPGAVLAVLDTVVPGLVAGALPSAQVEWLDAVAADATAPVLVFGHHPIWNVDTPERTDANYAIALDDSVALADVVRRRPSISGYFAGHTHSNRVFRSDRARRVPFVEVACTKDYPGAWAEYRIHEGGYTQVMRRVADPEATAWSEQARTMIQGIYRDLVLGEIEDRCFMQPF